jgi:hypothetical protein
LITGVAAIGMLVALSGLRSRRDPAVPPAGRAPALAARMPALMARREVPEALDGPDLPVPALAEDRTSV